MKPRVESSLASSPIHASSGYVGFARTSVELTSRQDNHPDAGLGASLCNQIADIHRQGSIKEDGQKLETDDALFHFSVGNKSWQL